MIVRSKAAGDGDALAAIWTERYDAPTVAARDILHKLLDLPGFVAMNGDALMGALTFAQVEDEIEVVTLDSLRENAGIGTALLDAAVALARAERAFRLCLVTTNDNFRAPRFYQRRGWAMSGFYRDSVMSARRIKPQIPTTGTDGIPILHEIEFEFRL
ncbi:MAG: GNAT family N-acetyltransferase [Rhizomicrobium sp.]